MSLLAQGGNMAAGHCLPALNTMTQPMLLSGSPATASPSASEPSATTLVQDEQLTRVVSLRQKMSLFMADADINSLMQELCAAAAAPDAPAAAAPGAPGATASTPAAAAAPRLGLTSRVSFRELMSQHSSPCAGSNATQLSAYDSPCSSLGDAWTSLGSSSAGVQALLRGGSLGGAAAAPEPEGRVKAGRLHHRFSGTGSPSVSCLSPPPTGREMLSASAGMATGVSSLAGSPGAWDFPMPPPSMWPDARASFEAPSRAFAFAAADQRPRLAHSQSMSPLTTSLSAHTSAPEPRAALNEPKMRGGSSSGCGTAGKDRRVRGGGLPALEAAAQGPSSSSYLRARSYFPTVRSTCSIPELQELESLLERGFSSAPLVQALASATSGNLEHLMGQSLGVLGEPGGQAEGADRVYAIASAGERLVSDPESEPLPPPVAAGGGGRSKDDARCPLLHALSLPAPGATGYKVKLFRGTSSSRSIERGVSPAGTECGQALSSYDS